MGIEFPNCKHFLQFIMLIKRELAALILESAKKRPVITVTGPRQSGKTTLVREIFPDYNYVNLELPLTRERFTSDPLGFFRNIEKGIIIDEFQNVPDILSYIQVLSDEEKIAGKYILTGSQNFLMMEKLSQSLAGRTSLFNLLPFGVSEQRNTSFELDNSEDYIIKSLYPKIYSDELAPNNWLNDYINLYIEHDIKKIINLKNGLAFVNLLKLLAGRCGQILNYTSLSEILGIDAKTVRSWIYSLETCFIVYQLRPFYNNFNKRISKLPKLYFYDSGLVAALLGIKNRTELESHYLKGQLFENFVISEIIKYNYHKGTRKEFWFWNEQGLNEIDLLIESGGKISPVEIKASYSFSQSFGKSLQRFKSLIGERCGEAFLISNNEDEFINQGNNYINWKNYRSVFES